MLSRHQSAKRFLGARMGALRWPLIALSFLWPCLSFGQTQLTDQQIAELIIRDSRQAYYATGHPCACPEDRARNGSRCGGRSAYSRPGGAEPYCYVTDVPKEKI